MNGMKAGVEEDDARARPQQSRPHRDADDLGPTVGKEGGARKIDEARAQKSELDQE
jgi:hypothetical protein